MDSGLKFARLRWLEFGWDTRIEAIFVPPPQPNEPGLCGLMRPSIISLQCGWWSILDRGFFPVEQHAKHLKQATTTYYVVFHKNQFPH